MKVYIVTSAQIVGKLPEVETEAFGDLDTAQVHFQQILEGNPGNPIALSLSSYDTLNGRTEMISQLSAYA